MGLEEEKSASWSGLARLVNRALEGIRSSSAHHPQEPDVVGGQPNGCFRHGVCLGMLRAAGSRQQAARIGQRRVVCAAGLQTGRYDCATTLSARSGV